MRTSVHQGAEPGSGLMRRRAHMTVTNDWVDDAPPLEDDGDIVVVLPPTFDEVFDREYAPMVRVAYLMLGSNELAEETVQDAFVALHQQWFRVSNPGGYLRTSVVNRCRSKLRRRTTRARVDDKLRAEVVTSSGPASSAAPRSADELFDALATLSARQRAAVVLRYYADLPEAEIAEALGVRPGTVKSLLNRGLTQLREVIER